MAVSGGLDSMVMLDLFRHSSYAFAVAHVNFQLRGLESDADETFVKAKCLQWKIPFYSTRYDTNNYATQHGVSIQLAARELRYTWFRQLKQEHGFDWIATGHHQNDSIETVLLNLTKGTGLDGILGIPEKINDIIRPILFAGQEEIRKYAADAGITWREDESNQTDNYQRNFIRHQVVPRLKEINPSLETTFARTLEKLQGSSSLISVALDSWKEKFLSEKTGQVLFNKSGFSAVYSTAHNTLLLWELVKEFGFNYDQCQEIIRALHHQPGKRFLSTTHTLVIDRENLILTKHSIELAETQIKSNQQIASLGSRTLQLELIACPIQISASKTLAVVDANRTSYPLVWRKWKPGDYFFPLGMKQRKKISDFLIDEKVPLPDKESVTVLTSSGEIVWVVGYRLDDRFKLTEKTAQAIQLSIQQ